MDPKRWQQVEELFRTMIENPVVDREAYLTQVCPDQDLRREVLSLLSRDTAEDFLNGPILTAAISVTSEPEDRSGERIGAYRVLRLIGRGGMGAVYEAAREDENFKQHAAIKLIKRGMDTDFVRDRFLRERQILASLDHPYIARLFDGGSTRDGLPYFVMEFVDGERITDYAINHNLSLNQKLELFRNVCSAVQHAHQRLVIHRDLKPSNILVTADGTPRLLDFGISKLLTPDSFGYTQTDTALRLMTPDYASPEQARGGMVTTSTDVYSLGIVLYELLTGARPYEFKTTSPADIERTICEVEPEAPSKVLTRAHGAPAKLIRQLAGDLDNIALMALRKEPARRYQSVEQFSEDIRRHLAELPVIARKSTFGYNAAKFVQRHKTGAGVLGLLAILAVVFAFQSLRIRSERDRANQEAATAQAVTQSLVSMFEIADPVKARGNAITARELLDEGAGQVVRDLKSQPLVQARLMDTIGWLYQGIGAMDKAQPLLEESLRLRREHLGNEHHDIALSLSHLAEVAFQRGDAKRSEPLFREALAMRRNLLGKEHPEVAESLDRLGSFLVDQGKFSEAEPMLTEALALRRKLFGEQHADVAVSLNSLGRLLSDSGKFREAEANYRQALEIRRQIYGNENVRVAQNLNNLAAMLQEQGDFKGAEPLFREALVMRTKLLGEEHPDVASSMANLASVLQDLNRLDESEEMYRRVLAVRRRTYGDEHPRLATTMNNLATLLLQRKAFDEAETLFRQALAIRRKEFGNDHHEVGTSLFNLATLLLQQGKYAESEAMHREAIDTYRRTFKSGHWMIGRSRSCLGETLMKLRRYDEAEAEMLAGYAELKAQFGEKHSQTQKAAARLVTLYEILGQGEKAVPFRPVSPAATVH